MKMRLALALLLAPLWAGVPAVQPLAARAPAAVHAPVAVPHQRVVALEGGRNFRDLGGYRAAGGHTVKWGLLYRSGSMTGLTAGDYATLEKRGIRVVCDLRDSRERAAEPVNWPGEPGREAPRVLFDDYQLDQSALMPKGPPGEWTADAARASFAASYPRILAQFNGQYRRMFAELLAGHAPLAFNCSAGKDRTGIGAALLLTALGVPRETVIADYLLSNQTLNPAALMAGKASAAGPLAHMPPEVAKVFMGVDRRYIEAVFAVTDAHQGGTPGYLRDELGLGPAQIRRLRALYLS